MGILQLARKTDFRNVESIVASMEKMVEASDAEIDRIMFYKLVFTEQLSIRTAISLATLERERRAAKAARDLAFKTTKFASWMGILGALIGAVVGAVSTLVLPPLLQFFL